MKAALACLACAGGMLLGGCGRSDSAAPVAGPGSGGGVAAAAHGMKPPAGDPAQLPKVEASQTAIAAMLSERFGWPVARTIRIGIETTGSGKRLVLAGEVPNEDIRQAVMKEVETRVEGVQLTDFRLEVSGAVPMIGTFDVRLIQVGPELFTPDLRVFVSDAGEVFEVATGRRINAMALPDREVECMAISPDGKLLVTGHKDGLIQLWQMPEATQPRQLVGAGDVRMDRRIAAVTFTPDSRGVVSISKAKGEIMLWDIATGKGKTIGAYVPATSSRGAPDRYAVAVSPDGKIIATGTDGYGMSGVWLWDIASRSKKTVLDAERLEATSLAWSPDGTMIAAARTTDNVRGTAVFDVATGKSRVLSNDSNGLIHAVAFSPDGRTLAVRYDDQDLVLWDVADGTKWQTIPKEKESGGQAMRFSPDGNILATGCVGIQPSGVRLWDVSARPGGKGGTAQMPEALSVERRNDRLAMEIEQSIRGSRPAGDVKELHVEALPDGSIRLRGKVTDHYLKRDATERAANMHATEDLGPFGKRKVINELEVVGGGSIPMN